MKRLKFWWYRNMPWYIKLYLPLGGKFYGYNVGDEFNPKALPLDLCHKFDIEKKWVYCGNGMICLLKRF